MIEDLRKVKINDLTDTEIQEHRNNVLKLEKNDILEYLKFALDNFYKSEEEGENDKNIDMFFDADEFLEYYQILEKENNEG